MVWVNHLAASAYPSKAGWLLNSRLSKASLDRAGFGRLPDWKDAVERYLQEIMEA